ncbi:MAG: hypothetical protein Q8O22_06830 [Candidatus Omnitrophota bacterium]|nr:hypothetical protein [Candidatus Omnitrophota bacterium]
MIKKIMILAVSIFLVLNLKPSWAAQWGRADTAELEIENISESDRTATLKLFFLCGADSQNIEISGFLPEGIQLLDTKDYKIEYNKSGYREWGNSVIFFSGPMKRNERRNFIFKVQILDNKKYAIRAGGGDASVAVLEIDLGEPEPPELNNQSEVTVVKEEKPLLVSGIKQIKEKVESAAPNTSETMSSLRTELRMRTKDRPSIDYYKDKLMIIPFRYLIYTEVEAPQTVVTLNLPQGIEFVKEAPYEVSILEGGQQQVLLYSGPMRFKECKALYFNVRVLTREEKEYPVEVTARVTTLNGKTLLKEDKMSIDMQRKLF